MAPPHAPVDEAPRKSATKKPASRGLSPRPAPVAPVPVIAVAPIGALADVLRDRDPAQRQPLFLTATRRIEATFAISPPERHAAVRQLADRLIPLA